MPLLYDLLEDVLKVDDVLFVVKSKGATSEIRSNGLRIRQKNQWITIGENDGPCHMHINSDTVKSADFVREQKPDRVSFSIRFYDSKEKEKGDDDGRVLAAFFTKMYDENKTLNESRVELFERINKKYGEKTLTF